MPQSENVIAELVETMRALAGSYPGFRPAHAKGIVCAGTFRATSDARRITRAPHLQGQEVPTVIRFSNSSGDPDAHDGAPSTRAMAVKFQLPGGKNADILGNSVEGFRVRTPEEFLEFLRGQLPDVATGQARADAVSRFVGSHPAAAEFLARLTPKSVPESFARLSYHGNHAFRFMAADGSSRFGRYHWTPEAGEAYLSPEEGAARDPNFLRAELETRLGKGSIGFRLFLQLAEAADPIDDITALWPETRRRVELGRLEIARISPSSASDERALVFDPTNLTDGIELPNDPILLARSAAYSLSYDYRSKNQ